MTQKSEERERVFDAFRRWGYLEASLDPLGLPANMGALFYAQPLLERAAGGRPVRSVKRSASASPATGSAKAHELEQKTLLTLAFTT